MRIVFLDIDGVLNHVAFLKNRFDNVDSTLPRLEWRAVSGMCPERVQRLNAIIEATDAKVVISSSWRMGYEVDELRWMLKRRGFSGEVIGCIPRRRDNQTPRGEYVEEWLSGCEHDVVSFVCLDDDVDMFPYADRHVHTSLEAGLTQEHVEQAIEMLEGE